MISIKTTPKFNGIAIQGDFDDLNQLYDAISEYSNFYLNGEQIKELPESRLNIGEFAEDIQLK